MISVNHTIISDEAVAREVQHHPAPTRDEAGQQAATALVVRELLLQRAAFLGMDGESEEDLLANLVGAGLAAIWNFGLNNAITWRK